MDAIRVLMSMAVLFCVSSVVSAERLTDEVLGEILYSIASEQGWKRLQTLHEKQGDYSDSVAIDFAQKVVIHEMSKAVIRIFRMEGDSDEVNEDGRVIGRITPESRNIRVLNKAYYCSKMLESVEQKFEQFIDSDGLDSHPVWLAELIGAIEANDYTVAQALVCGAQATKDEVRALLDACGRMQCNVMAMQVEDAAYLKKRAIPAYFAATMFASLGGLAGYRCFRDLLLASSCALIAGVFTLAGLLHDTDYSDAARLRSNAIFQLIVERFLNGTDL